jgi:hypothetical protein
MVARFLCADAVGVIGGSVAGKLQAENEKGRRVFGQSAD